MDKNDLSRVLDVMAFKSQSVNNIVDLIVRDLMIGRDPDHWRYKSPSGDDVTRRVNFYANKYGNLGASRRKMAQKVTSAIRRIERRASKRRWGIV